MNWDLFVSSVVNDRCTAFIGAGIAKPHLPDAREFAQSLATAYGYPWSDNTDLSRVAQYMATKNDPPFAKAAVATRVDEQQKAFTLTSGVSSTRNHRLLAELELPLYVTTNYDTFLEEAFSGEERTFRTDTSRWNSDLFDDLGHFDRRPPDRQTPLIFHMHGTRTIPDSILVSDDDYLDFAANLAVDKPAKSRFIPLYVRKALARHNLLFIGYSLDDWNFRLMLRLLKSSIARTQGSQAVSIQLGPKEESVVDKSRLKDAEEFIAKYLMKSDNIEIEFSDAEVFLMEFVSRVKAARP